MSLSVGLLLFPRMTQLDATGPYEVFYRLPAASVHLIAEDEGPVRTEHGLTILAEHGFQTAPPFDLLCVPGGPGIDGVLESERAMAFVRERGLAARWLTSVCTGALVLGAAGLLRSRRATTHWLSLDLLARCGATPVEARVVRDGHVFTGGGVTAGIDFALTVAAEVAGIDAAERTQLILEYAPAPPLAAGSPKTARPEITASLREGRAALHARRAELIDRAIARW
jgi:cyclohexyl-isocyanide hydratase